MDRQSKIIFFEDRNFKGRYYECTHDCPELSTYFSRCNSIHVESASWVIYERPTAKGYQYVLTIGEYPDLQHWLGYRSCRIVRNTPDKFLIRLYERPDFSGQVMESSEDLPSVSDRFHSHEVQSCKVLAGAWVFYEQPNYQGWQYLLEGYEFYSHTDWDAIHPTVGSVRCVTEF